MRYTPEGAIQNVTSHIDYLIGNSKAISKRLLKDAVLPEGMSQKQAEEMLTKHLDETFFSGKNRICGDPFSTINNACSEFMSKNKVIINSSNTNLLKAELTYFVNMTTIGDVLEKIDKEKLADNKQMKLLGKQIQESVLNGMMNNKEKYKQAFSVLHASEHISLEDIISMNSAEKLTNIFSEYLDEEQMEIFNQNLVKNFSLQNVVESITILNPDKLLDEVEQAVGRLQKITGRKIAGRIMIGLYVHLCCLVERLVTKTPIDNYQDLEEFEQKHADFIRQVRDSFQDISRHYRVALPVSEIAYIYDYMHLNSKNKLSGQAESPAVREDE